MKTPGRRLVAVAALLSVTGCPPPDDPLPQPQTCAPPSAPPGAFAIDLGGPDGPWGEGAVVPLEVGGQGFRMLAVRTYLAGESIPACVMQDLDVRVDGRDAGGAVHNLPFRRDAAGGFVGETVHVVVFGVYAGAELLVTVTIGGQSVAKRVYAEQLPAPRDAGMDAVRDAG